MECLIINLEQGRPTVEVARQRMNAALRSAHAQRRPTLKLIHGYGSSGQGGKIRTMVRQELTQMRAQGRIREFVVGEEFSPFEVSCQRAVSLCFDLTRDCDYTRCNHGVTLVVL